jgi:lauroyl/myristoyl acyltransferase
MTERRELLAYATYRLASVLAARFSDRTASYLAGCVGWVWAQLSPRRRDVVRRHLEVILGPDYPDSEIAPQVRRAFASYGRYWAESFRLPLQDPKSIAGRLHIEGIGYLEEAVRSGRGVIVALPHLGSWDFGGAWLAAAGYRPIVVVEELKPERLFWWFVALRTEMGMRVVTTGPRAASILLRELRSGGLVALVADRDIGGHGVEVEMFGHPTRIPAGPALLALRSGAALLPVAVYEADRWGRHVAVVRPPLEVGEVSSGAGRVRMLSQRLAQEFEVLISAAPEQWHVFQPNWS